MQYKCDIVFTLFYYKQCGYPLKNNRQIINIFVFYILSIIYF